MGLGCDVSDRTVEVNGSKINRVVKSPWLLQEDHIKMRVTKENGDELYFSKLCAAYQNPACADVKYFCHTLIGEEERCYDKYDPEWEQLDVPGLYQTYFRAFLDAERNTEDIETERVKKHFNSSKNQN